MKRLFHLMLLASVLLVGCGTVAPAQTTLPFVLVTSAPNGTMTPTPFQPIPWTPTGSPPPQPTIDSAALTATLVPATPTQQPTIDPNILINTVAPLSTIDAGGSQILNNGQETINFLLIGSDQRHGSSFRTDTMVIAILRPKEGQVSLISIPRDLWVSIPDTGTNRINTAFEYGEMNGYPGGGAGLLKDTILYNLGIRIDHTAFVDFNGFRQIIDTLGGVDVPVSCPYTDWRLIDPSYDPNNPNNWALYTTGPGLIHMDGDLALWYARSRQKSNDFDRGRRQQEVLRSLFSQALQAGTLKRLPELYNDLKSTVETDLNLGDLLQLALYAPKMTNANIRSYYIRPPYVQSWITDAGAYVLLPNKDALQQLLTQAMSPSATTEQRKKITVDVMNGTATTGFDSLASMRLNYAGYVTNPIPSDRQDYAYSVLIDKTAEQDRNQSDAILNVLGLSPTSLISSPDPNSKTNYLLIVGYDYQTCFKPENLAP